MLLDKFRQVLVHNILGLDDTPHRIALGVLLGFLVAFTPTLGFQIILYVTLAALIRANKMSGIPILFISNPFTAVPLYWFVWKVGGFALGRAVRGEKAPSAEALDALFEGKTVFESAQTLVTSEFWGHAVATAVDLGAELWLGALIVGLLVGVPSYFITVGAVRGFRTAKAKYLEHHGRHVSGRPPAA
jgi:uncharacterized protein